MKHSPLTGRTLDQDQTYMGGDPPDAGRLLVTKQFTISELKILDQRVLKVPLCACWFIFLHGQA